MPLLSRVATTLYVFGRELESAEHLARILRVHSEMSLDRSLPRQARFWPAFLELAGWPAVRSARRDQAIGMAIGDPDGPSLARSVEAARQAAQAVRPSLSTEVFEQVNLLYWRIQEGGWEGSLYDHLHQLELATQLIGGLVEDTMAHDEAWSFVRLGKFFVRATGVTRLVVRKGVELARSGDDAVAWSSVLRCCSSFETYRFRLPAVTRAEAIAFLLFDRVSPRSAGFGVAESLATVRRIDGADSGRPPHRALGQLAALFEYADPVDVVRAPAAFGNRVDRLAGEVARTLRQAYFQPIALANSVVEGLSSQPQQQQQQGQWPADYSRTLFV